MSIPFPQRDVHMYHHAAGLPRTLADGGMGLDEAHGRIDGSARAQRVAHG